MPSTLVTGADGFLGTRLTQVLADRGHEVIAATRRGETALQRPRVVCRATGDIERQPDWHALLADVHCVIHLAGRAHVLHAQQDALEVARRANVAPTLDLFRACQRGAVERFVYVSSVHVLGTTSGTTPFTEASPANPQDPYAQSKWEAECGLRQLAAQAARPALVIVRPTVICGARAKGNLARLVRLVARRLPLPFGSIGAPRNFVGLDNLCDLLERCATRPEAEGRTYLAADPETLTLPALIRSIARALQFEARLLPVPPTLLAALGIATGQRRQIERLTHALEVDASLARRELAWRNEVALADELAAMARSALRGP